jgi:CcmD family protein
MRTLMARFAGLRGLVVATLILVSFATVGARAVQQPPPSSAAQEGFVPIDQLQAKEQIPSAPLVMAAYAVAWIVMFVYLWSVWQRLRKVETEIADMSRRVAAGGRR